MSVDESLLTGESVPVRKTICDDNRELSRPGGEDLPFVYSGTLVVGGHGAARQGVFQNAQVHARFARFRPQFGHAAHFQTTVLGDDNPLRLRDFRGDFGDYRLLLVKIETQGLPPFVKAASHEDLRHPRRPCIQA